MSEENLRYGLGDTVMMKEKDGVKPHGVIIKVNKNEFRPYKVLLYGEGIGDSQEMWVWDDLIMGRIGKNIPQCTSHDTTMLYRNDLNIYYCPFCKQKFSIMDKLSLYKHRLKKRLDR